MARCDIARACCPDGLICSAYYIGCRRNFSLAASSGTNMSIPSGKTNKEVSVSSCCLFDIYSFNLLTVTSEASVLARLPYTLSNRLKPVLQQKTL